MLALLCTLRCLAVVGSFLLVAHHFAHHLQHLDLQKSFLTTSNRHPSPRIEENTDHHYSGGTSREEPSQQQHVLYCPQESDFFLTGYGTGSVKYLPSSKGAAYGGGWNITGFGEARGLQSFDLIGGWIEIEFDTTYAQGFPMVRARKQFDL